MKAAVIVFPGSNCDRDCKVAIERSTGAKVDMVWHAEPTLPSGLDLIVLPGGFSYGDYLRSGAMAAKSPIVRDVIAHAERGGLVLGICNGFQVLTEARMLPGALLRNEALKYVCKPVALTVANGQTRFTAGYQGRREVVMTQGNGDGNFFAGHTDKYDSEEPGISLVYLFAGPEKGFTGGANVFYDTNVENNDCDCNSFTLLPFADNRLVVFPGKHYHGVLPVRCADNRFENGRFSLVTFLDA